MLENGKVEDNGAQEPNNVPVEGSEQPDPEKQLTTKEKILQAK